MMQPNSGNVEVPGSPGWVRPSDVMRHRKLRAKRHALQARMSSSTKPLLVHSSQPSAAASLQQHRRNPFKRSPAKKMLESSVPFSNNDLSSDATLFNLLHNPHLQEPTSKATQNAHFTFTQALRQQGIAASEAKKPLSHWQDNLIVDWSLKTKLRFIADAPLPWKHNFKTSEEASGTTGMARCLWSDNTSNENNIRTTDLDTSPNAEFYQRCLVWQHPSLPGVTLFPRDGIRAGQVPGSSNSNSMGRPSSSTGPYADSRLAASLQAAWCEALRSLHQLLRVRQCPYFYVCAPSFTVLYRAAGVCSIPHAHALLTPTTRGLRAAMREEGIEFKMPFYRQPGHHDNSNSCMSKSSHDSDSTCASTTIPNVSQWDEEGENDDDGEEEEETEEASSFLANLGVDTSQFANLNPNRVKSSGREIDRSPLSLVFIADPDTQGLTNFLLNSPSCVAATGPLAGVPPTLLAPVAFQGATLLPYKVKGGSVRVRGSPQYSMEVTGPVLPHTPLQLASLLTQHLPSFSLHSNPIPQTLPFSNCTSDICPKGMTKAFAEEGLVDCGLDAKVRSLVCEPLRAEQQQHNDGTKTPTCSTGDSPVTGHSTSNSGGSPSTGLNTSSGSSSGTGASVGSADDNAQHQAAKLPPSYRQVTYENGRYTWTDQHVAVQ